MALAVSGYAFDEAMDRIEMKAVAQCEAGNDRSRLQYEEELDTRHRQLELDWQDLFNATPEDAEEIKRLALESSNRRIDFIPWLNCQTGKRLPHPPSNLPPIPNP